jgi:DNA-binding CsgD family transcriptional regulator/GAF domain-containing protein
VDAAPEALLQFVAEVARADTIETLQARYLDGIREFIGGFAAGLYLLNPFTHGAETYAARGVSDFFLSRYEELGRSRDPVLTRALADGTAVDNGMLMSPTQWRALPVYADVFGLHRMTGLLEVPLLEGGAAIGTLNFGRNDSDGPFTGRDRVLAQAIAQLVGVAVVSARERARLARERDRTVAALELCSEAIAVTDLRANQRRINAATRGLLERLSDAESALDELMAHPVTRLGRPGRKPAADHGAPSARANLTAQCHEIEVRLRDGRAARLRARSTAVDGESSVIVSFLELLGQFDAPSLPAVLGSALTRREREVAAFAAAGLHDAEIAERLALSPYTIKQYLKAAYAKLGVRSRVDLARLAIERRPG